MKIDITIPPFKNLILDLDVKAMLFFGSRKNGDYWKNSDIDLFLLTNHHKNHQAFFINYQGIECHINSIPPRNFKKILSNPTKRTLHSILVQSEIIFNKTSWLQNEKKRLQKYPEKNKLYQIIDRLEFILTHINSMEKDITLQTENNLFSYHISLEKLFEIDAIHLAKYFGKSVLRSLSKKKQLFYTQALKEDTAGLSKLLTQKIKKYLDLYLPKWCLEISNQIITADSETLADKFQLRLEHIYDEAGKRNLCKFTYKKNKRRGGSTPIKMISFR